MGCKALSSSIHELWQGNSLSTERAETTRDEHAEKVSDNKGLVQRCFKLQPMLVTLLQDAANSIPYHEAHDHLTQQANNLQRSK